MYSMIRVTVVINDKVASDTIILSISDTSFLLSILLACFGTSVGQTNFMCRG